VNTIAFKLNEPQILSLADTTPDLDGTNWVYPTEDGRLLALPRHVAIKLGELDPAPGEGLSITRMRKEGQPAEWVIALTPRAEKARAEKERPELERQLAESIAFRCSDCGNPAGSQHKPSCHRQGLVTSASDYRDRDATGNLAPQKAVRLKPTGTDGPAREVQPLIQMPKLAARTASGASGGRVPYLDAFRHATEGVTRVLHDLGEQWNDQAKQDAVCTLLIAAAKGGHIVFDFQGVPDGR
jgi:hypothetical protein